MNAQPGYGGSGNPLTIEQPVKKIAHGHSENTPD